MKVSAPEMLVKITARENKQTTSSTERQDEPRCWSVNCDGCLQWKFTIVIFFPNKFGYGGLFKIVQVLEFLSACVPADFLLVMLPCSQISAMNNSFVFTNRN